MTRTRAALAALTVIFVAACAFAGFAWAHTGDSEPADTHGVSVIDTPEPGDTPDGPDLPEPGDTPDLPGQDDGPGHGNEHSQPR